jgi:hypothetical protein
MHQVESYALACGAKIDKPFLYEHYFPTPSGVEYITLQKEAKFPSRQYKYWQQVVDLLYPILSKRNIKILQIGTPEDKPLESVVFLGGATSIKQVHYVIRKSVLHLGIDSFAVHVASNFGKKIVALYSNMHPENSGPYWSDPEDCKLILSPLDGKRPSYAFDENPKTINKIKPEEVAEAVCELLGLDFKKPYETIYLGERYGEDNFFVFVPDSLHFVEENKDKPIEYRMDYHFSEQHLTTQLQICKCGIVTDKPINLDILRNHRPNVSHLIYKITENDNPKFVHSVRKLGIKIMLVSKLPKEQVTKKKMDYYSVGGINVIEEKEQDVIDKLNESENLSYKSSKIIMSDKQTYSSRPKYDKGTPSMGNFEAVEKSEEFYDDLDHFHIVKMLD